MGQKTINLIKFTAFHQNIVKLHEITGILDFP